MSDLQIGLIALGVLLILLVLGFNWWQDRRARSRMQARFPATEQDPLFGANEAAGRTAAPEAQRREPGMGVGQAPAHAAAAAAPAPSNDLDDTEEPDPACEIVIEVQFGEPVRGADLLAAVQGLDQVGRKPVRLFASTDRGRHRARIHPEESYASLQLAVFSPIAAAP